MNVGAMGESLMDAARRPITWVIAGGIVVVGLVLRMTNSGSSAAASSPVVYDPGLAAPPEPTDPTGGLAGIIGLLPQVPGGEVSVTLPGGGAISIITPPTQPAPDPSDPNPPAGGPPPPPDCPPGWRLVTQGDADLHPWWPQMSGPTPGTVCILGLAPPATPTPATPATPPPVAPPAAEPPLHLPEPLPSPVAPQPTPTPAPAPHVNTFTIAALIQNWLYDAQNWGTRLYGHPDGQFIVEGVHYDSSLEQAQGKQVYTGMGSGDTHRGSAFGMFLYRLRLLKSQRDGNGNKALGITKATTDAQLARMAADFIGQHLVGQNPFSY